MSTGEEQARDSRPPILERVLLRARSPIDSTILAYFRIVFGATMLWYVGRQYYVNTVGEYYIQPSFHFKFPYFEWIAVPAPWLVHAMFAAMAVAAFGIFLGAFYHTSVIAFFLLRTYVFLMDQSVYVNHEYFACLLAFCLIFVPAERTLSVDAARRPDRAAGTVERWPLWLLRFQIGTVYFWGGIAKFDDDWLAGSFARIALVSRSDLPVIGGLFELPATALFVAWGGLVFDLSIAFLLLNRRTWKYAVPLVLGFHFTNFVLFEITFFPWLMIFATPIFLDPDLMARLRPAPADSARPSVTASTSPWIRRVAAAALGTHVLLQILLPCRQFLFPSNSSWHEEGVRFSWQMMLKDKSGTIRFMVLDRKRPGVQPLVVAPLAPRSVLGSGEPLSTLNLTGPQYSTMSIDPDLMIQFAHHIRRTLEARGFDVEVRAQTEVFLNGRKPQSIVDPYVDLSREKRSAWRHKSVIEPLEKPRPPLGEEWWLEGLKAKIRRQSKPN